MKAILILHLVNSAFGTRKRNLTFPAFNQDSLNQWANGDTELGRIKIVISEGVAGTTVDEGEAGEVSYMRLKNIVCFYYRYAPQGQCPSIYNGVVTDFHHRVA